MAGDLRSGAWGSYMLFLRLRSRLQRLDVGFGIDPDSPSLLPIATLLGSKEFITMVHSFYEWHELN
jgi:hypothetical protein